jgi:hypothetical protein
MVFQPSPTSSDLDDAADPHEILFPPHPQQPAQSLDAFPAAAKEIKTVAWYARLYAAVSKDYLVPLKAAVNGFIKVLKRVARSAKLSLEWLFSEKGWRFMLSVCVAWLLTTKVLPVVFRYFRQFMSAVGALMSIAFKSGFDLLGAVPDEIFKFVNTRLIPEMSADEPEVSFSPDAGPTRPRIAALSLLLAVLTPAFNGSMGDGIFSDAKALASQLTFGSSVLSGLAQLLPLALQNLLFTTGILERNLCSEPQARILLESANALADVLEKDPKLLALPTHFARYERITAELQKLISTYICYQPESAPVRFIAYNVQKRLHSHTARYNSIRALKPRVPALGLWLEGSPGVGKSWLVSQVADLFCPEVSPNGRVYSRDVDDKFYSAYLGQPVMLLDDFCVNKQLSDNDKIQISQMMRLMSIDPPALNQADSLDKGNIHFSTSLVAVTTNRKLTDPWPLVKPFALVRRFFAIRVVLKDEFALPDGLINQLAVAKAREADPYNLAPHLLFYPYVPTSDPRFPLKRVLAQKPITLQEIVDHLQHLYIVNLASAVRRNASDLIVPAWKSKDFSFQPNADSDPQDQKQPFVAEPPTFADKVKKGILTLQPLPAAVPPLQAGPALVAPPPADGGPIPLPILEEKESAKGPPKPYAVSVAQSRCGCWYRCPKALTGPGRESTLCELCKRTPCPDTCDHPRCDAQITDPYRWWNLLVAFFLRTEGHGEHTRLRITRHWILRAALQFPQELPPLPDGSRVYTKKMIASWSIEETLKRIPLKFLVTRVWNISRGCCTKGSPDPVPPLPPPEVLSKELPLAEFSHIPASTVQECLDILQKEDPNEVLVHAFTPDAAAVAAQAIQAAEPKSHSTVFERISSWYYDLDLKKLGKALFVLGAIIGAAASAARLLLPVFNEEEMFTPDASGGPSKEKLDRSRNRGRKQRQDRRFIHAGNSGPKDFVMGNGRHYSPEGFITSPRDVRLTPAVIESMSASLRKVHGNVCGIQRFGIRMYAWSPGGRQLWVPRHFFYAHPEVMIPDGTVLTISNCVGTSHNVSFKSAALKHVPVGSTFLDLVSLQLPAFIPEFKDLRSKIPKDSRDFPVEKAMAAIFVRAPVIDPDDTYLMLSELNYSSEHIPYSVRGDAQPHHLILPGYFSYDHHSCPGDCGAPVVAFFPDGTANVIGLHTGTRTDGLDKRGTAVALSQDLFAVSYAPEAKLDCPSLDPPVRNLPFTSASKTVFNYLGEMKHPRFINGKSRLTPTNLALAKHPLLGSVTHRPAILANRERSAALRTFEAMLDIAPEGAKTTPWPDEIAGPVIEHMVEQARTLRVTAEPPRVLTKSEALNGACSSRWMDKILKRLALNRNAGYPYDQFKPLGEKGRAFLFKRLNLDGDLDFNPEFSLEADLDALLAFTKGDPYPWIAYILGLKDELRRAQKVDKPRLIAYSSVLITLAARMQFGSFTMSDMFRNGFASSVGINVDSADWDQLWTRLSSHLRDLFIDGDFSFFDSIINSQVTEAFKLVTDAYYGDVGNKALRHFLIDNCMLAHLIVGSSVIDKTVGGTTGNPLTVHLNNFTNEFTQRCAFRALALRHSPEHSAPDMFDLLTALCVYGDDFVLALAREAASWLTFQSLRDVLKERGITMTDPGKSLVEVAPHKSIHEVQYLSRSVRVDPSKSLAGVQYLAHNNKEDFRSLAWRSDKLHDEFACAANATGILYRSVGRGKEEWTKVYVDLVNALASQGYSPRLPGWIEVTRNFVQRTYNYSDYLAQETVYEMYNKFSAIPLSHVELHLDALPSLETPRWGSSPRQSFEVNMEAVAHEDLIPASSAEAKAESIAPSAPVPQVPSMLSCTAEDMMKNWQPLYNIPTTADPINFWTCEMFCPDRADPSPSGLGLVPANGAYFGGLFRFMTQGPYCGMLAGGTDKVSISFTTLLDPTGLMATQVLPSADQVLAGSMSLQLGWPQQFPLMVQIPAQQLNPENFILVPQNRTEVLANYDPNLWGGTWVATKTSSDSPTPSNVTRFYVTVGDGFRLSMLYRIPSIRYSTLAPPLEKKFEPNGAVASTASKGIKAATGTYANLKQVADQSVDVANKIADKFARFDTPNSVSQTPVLGQFGPDMPLRANLRHCQVLGPVNEQPNFNPPFNTSEPETRLLGIAMKEVLFQTTRVTPDMEPGHELLRIPITCAPDTFRQTTNVLFQPVPMEYIAIPFTFWKGSLRLRGQSVGCPMSNMRIGVLTRYGSFGETVTVDLFSSQYAFVYNLGLEDSFEISIPYISPQEWCRVPVPDSLGDTRVNKLDYALGEIIVVVITPLQVNETMAQEMDFNFFLSAGPDMEFKAPAENLARVSMTEPPGESKVSFTPNMLKTGIAGGDHFDDETKEVVVRPLGGHLETTTPNDGADALWARSFVLPEIPWSDAAMPGTILWSQTLPAGIIPDGPVATIISSFKLIRCNLMFSFGMSTTMSQQGQVIAFFTPILRPPAQVTLREVMLLPHILLKAGHTTSGKLLVPYVHPRNALDLTLGDWRSTMGSIAVMVFNQLKSGDSAPDTFPTINVSVQFLNMELSVPNPASPMSKMRFAPEGLCTVRPRFDYSRVNDRLWESVRENLKDALPYEARRWGSKYTLNTAPQAPNLPGTVRDLTWRSPFVPPDGPVPDAPQCMGAEFCQKYAQRHFGRALPKVPVSDWPEFLTQARDGDLSPHDQIKMLSLVPLLATNFPQWMTERLQFTEAWVDQDDEDDIPPLHSCFACGVIIHAVAAEYDRCTWYPGKAGNPPTRCLYACPHGRYWLEVVEGQYCRFWAPFCNSLCAKALVGEHASPPG